MFPHCNGKSYLLRNLKKQTLLSFAYRGVLMTFIIFQWDFALAFKTFVGQDDECRLILSLVSFVMDDERSIEFDCSLLLVVDN